MNTLVVGIGFIVLFGALLALWTGIGHTAARKEDGSGAVGRSQVVHQLLRIAVLMAVLVVLLTLVYIKAGWV